MKDRILRTYMGVVTGSTAGRDDGYPERKYSSHMTLKDAVYRTRPGIASQGVDSEEFFELVPISKERIDAAIAVKRKDEQRDKKANIDIQIKDLQAKRRKLRSKGEKK